MCKLNLIALECIEYFENQNAQNKPEEDAASNGGFESKVQMIDISDFKNLLFNTVSSVCTFNNLGSGGLPLVKD